MEPRVQSTLELPEFMWGVSQKSTDWEQEWGETLSGLKRECKDEGVCKSLSGVTVRSQWDRPKTQENKNGSHCY